MNKLQLVPIICFILFPTAFIATYTIALSKEHVLPFFAYISDTGTLPPEMCWFALLLSLTSIALGVNIYIRYRQIQAFYFGKKARFMNILNRATMIIGMISSLGVMIVGSFQETSVLSIHVFGAFLSFLVGAIYLTLQAYFTFKMLPAFTTKCVAALRLVIGSSCIILFAMTYVFGVMSFKGFQGTNALKWSRDEPNYYLRAISVSSEWIMAALFDIYILSFALDFGKIRFKTPQVNTY